MKKTSAQFNYFLVDLLCTILLVYVVLFSSWTRWIEVTALFCTVSIFVYAWINFVIKLKEQENMIILYGDDRDW